MYYQLNCCRMQVVFIKRHSLLTVVVGTAAVGIIFYWVWYRCVTSQREERLQSLASGLYELMEKTSHDSYADDPEDDIPDWLSSIKQLQMSQHQNTTDFKTRSTEYCRPLSHIMQGEEGQVNKSLKLVNVHIFIRHGDRSPIYGLSGIKAPSISCVLQKQQANSDVVNSYLKWLKELKHFSGYQYPNNSVCESGQLTPQGIMQHIYNGQYLSSVYRNSIFSHTYDNNSRPYMGILIRTSENTRNIQSALAFAYGLVDTNHTSSLNFSIKIIDVSNVTNFCSQRLAKVPCHCPVLEKGYTQRHLSKEHTQIVKYHTGYARVKARFASVLNVSHVPWLGVGLDVLMAYVCHHQKLPCVSQTGKCFTNELVNDMWRVIDQTAETEFKAKTKKSYSSLLMYPLLREIAYRLRNITEGLAETTPTVVLYSGHDKMLIPMAMALGLYDGKWPGFSSRLVIELYRRDKTGGFYLRVLFNGKDKTIKMTICTQFHQGLCPLNHFLKSVFSQRFKSSNSYRKVCNGRSI